MKVLGINSYFHCSAAAVVDDGEVLAAVKEERIIRKKYAGDFPFKAIEFCLKKSGLELKDIDCITFSVDLAIYLEHLNTGQLSSLRYRGELGSAVANALISLTSAYPRAGNFVQEWESEGKKYKLQFVNHHISHAALAFYLSPYEEAAILTLDGFGEKACQLMATGRGNKIEPLEWVEFPHSLGMLYSTFTEYLGFRPNLDEWKVMGASSYGNPDRFYPSISKLVNVEGGKVELDLAYFNFFLFHRKGCFSDKLVELLGPPRKREDKMTQTHFDIAAAVQKVTEESGFKLASYLHEKTGLKNLCVCGGVFLNSVMNGKLLERTGFESIYIPAAPDDSGGAVGSALYYIHALNDIPRKKEPQYNYWGPEFSKQEVEDILKLCRFPYLELDNPAKTGAKLLTEGNILGWFQGALEFGDRALGNRSIVADPRDPGMKDHINAHVKFREEFRPFAPSILEEYVDDYFVSPQSTPFMEKVYMIREEKREIIPAVTHVDGTGRLQTVTAEQNPEYFNLINEFKELTGVPVVLNTSFNVNNEPIVASPQDALRTFASCGMDFLIIGNYLIAKDPTKMKK